MAKKVRKDGERKEEKKAVFEAPTFDEREYLEEQLGNIRISLIFTFYAIPFGAIGAYIGATTGSGWGGLGFAILGYILGIFIVRFLFSIDLFAASKKQIITSVALFLFSYLAFAVLLSNPPVNDPGDPSITDMMIYYNKDPANESWEKLMLHKNRLPLNESNLDRIKKNPKQKYFPYKEGLTAKQGDYLSVLVRVADPAGMRGVWLETWYDEITEPPQAMERVTESRWDELDTDIPYKIWGEHYWEAQLPADRQGNLYIRVTAEDVNGHTTVFETKYVDTLIVA